MIYYKKRVFFSTILLALMLLPVLVMTTFTIEAQTFSSCTSGRMANSDNTNAMLTVSPTTVNGEYTDAIIARWTWPSGCDQATFRPNEAIYLVLRTTSRTSFDTYYNLAVSGDITCEVVTQTPDRFGIKCTGNGSGWADLTEASVSLLAYRDSNLSCVGGFVASGYAFGYGAINDLGATYARCPLVDFNKSGFVSE